MSCVFVDGIEAAAVILKGSFYTIHFLHGSCEALRTRNSSTVALRQIVLVVFLQEFKGQRNDTSSRNSD